MMDNEQVKTYAGIKAKKIIDFVEGNIEFIELKFSARDAVRKLNAKSIELAELAHRNITKNVEYYSNGGFGRAELSEVIARDVYERISYYIYTETTEKLVDYVIKNESIEQIIEIEREGEKNA